MGNEKKKILIGAITNYESYHLYMFLLHISTQKIDYSLSSIHNNNNYNFF